MSLDSLLTKVSSLKMASREGHKSPHKVCMLLAVMDLIESDELKDNRIYFDYRLKQKYLEHFAMLATEQDQANPYLPFFHLRSDDFWQHAIKPGMEGRYQSSTTVGSPGALEQLVEYAYLDAELFNLMNDASIRSQLKAAIRANLSRSDRDSNTVKGSAWGVVECEAVVQDYMAMLEQELRGEKYSKAAHSRALIEKIGARSKGSIEFKHQNISAILIELGYPYINGYKPMYNYQTLLKHVILNRMDVSQQRFEAVAETVTQAPVAEPTQMTWRDILETAPERETGNIEGVGVGVREFVPRKYDFSQREQNNRNLGLAGEKFVVDYEKFRLQSVGRDDLAKKIEWTSQEKGDGAGFDILSFNEQSDEELFIEVKTTGQGKYLPFYLTDNELDFSKSFSDQYALYRVFQFRDRPKMFKLDGDLEAHVNLMPKVFQAGFRAV